MTSDTSNVTSLTRRKLYTKVWTIPMRHLAKEYGITDVGLAKICKKHDVPRPGVGYWAKLEYGKKVKKVKLPKTRPADEAVKIHHQPGTGPGRSNKPDPELDPDIAEAATKEHGTEAIVVPGKLVDPHQLLNKAIRDFEREKKPGMTNRSPDPRVSYGGGGIYTSPDTAMRAILAMDTLLKELDARGYKVRRYKDNYQFTILNESFCARIEEPCNQVTHEPQEDEWWPPKWDLLASGSLRLELCNEHGYRVRQWNDGKIQRIETVLNKFMMAALLHVQKRREAKIENEKRRIEKEKRQQEMREAEMRRWQEEQAQREEQKRVDGLLTEVAKWKQSREIRVYMAAVQAFVVEKYGGYDEGSELDQWLMWVGGVADRVDPMVTIS